MQPDIAETRLSTLGALLKPTLVRVWLVLFGSLATYDTLASQLELRTIRAWWGMSGSLMPWWGWLLVLQAILFYALFEYVRRQLGARGDASIYDDSAMGRKIENLASRLLEVEKAVGTVLPALSKAVETTNNMARLTWLDYKAEEFAQEIKRLEEYWNHLAQALAKPKSAAMGQPEGSLNTWRIVLIRLVDRLGPDSPTPLNVTDHPNYDINPARKAPGEEAVPDEETRFDFRRCYDQYQTALTVLKRAHEMLIGERGRLIAQVREQGRIAKDKTK